MKSRPMASLPPKVGYQRVFRIAYAQSLASPFWQDRSPAGARKQFKRIAARRSSATRLALLAGSEAASGFCVILSPRATRAVSKDPPRHPYAACRGFFSLRHRSRSQRWQLGDPSLRSE
jgi:hypothetical protein